MMKIVYEPSFRITKASSGCFTVIVAARKAERWIGAGVISILQQSLPLGTRLEVLVGIDKCRDTLQAIAPLAHTRLKVFYFDEHIGPYRIFNTLAAHAQGDLIFRFDADRGRMAGFRVSLSRGRHHTPLLRIDGPV